MLFKIYIKKLSQFSGFTLFAVYRDAGTSPGAVVIESSSSNVPRRSPAQSAAIRQLKPMKQRVGYLQQQVGKNK